MRGHSSPSVPLPPGMLLPQRINTAAAPLCSPTLAHMGPPYPVRVVLPRSSRGTHCPYLTPAHRPQECTRLRATTTDRGAAHVGRADGALRIGGVSRQEIRPSVRGVTGHPRGPIERTPASRGGDLAKAAVPAFALVEQPQLAHLIEQHTVA
eukprot:scaffold9776_cov126-Isochrysis_galbana.AAC.10